MAWYAVILAGGSGSRMGADCNKVFLPLAGMPVLCRSVAAFRHHVAGVVVVARTEELAACRALLTAWRLDTLVCGWAVGGEDRQASVRSGLDVLPADCDRVLIHDAARALVSAGVIQRVKDSVARCGTGVAAIPVVDTIKRVDATGCAVETPDRACLRAVQTPQGFDTALLRRAHAQAEADAFRGTDDASLVERLHVPVQLTLGSEDNLKLTTPQDLVRAEGLLRQRKEAHSVSFRIGQGYDVHRLVPDRKLILCGVEIPHDRGLLGHSDADVALHALMDAMLGAMALGDIGRHFPDTDAAYAGADSRMLLSRVTEMLAQQGAHVVNADVTIVAQRPKLLPYIPRMRENIAATLGIPCDAVNVKATTTERLGFEGAMEGISAQAVCLIERS